MYSKLSADQLLKQLKDEGATIAGFSNLEQLLPANLLTLNNGITIGIQLSDFIINEIDTAPTYSYYHHYRTVNALIDQITLKAINWIQDSGYQATCIAASQTITQKGREHSGLFPHKTAATRAGLGWIGKSGLFLSGKLGPRVRLGTILTDMPLPPGQPVKSSDCGSCTLCRDHCPAKAIHGQKWSPETSRESLIDVHKCSEYMRTHFTHPGRGSVCGICIRVCPIGNATPLKEISHE